MKKHYASWVGSISEKITEAAVGAGFDDFEVNSALEIIQDTLNVSLYHIDVPSELVIAAEADISLALLGDLGKGTPELLELFTEVAQGLVEEILNTMMEEANSGLLN